MPAMKVLFVVTELQRPVGGLYRFAVELLPAWRKAFAQGRTQFEPLVFSMKDPLAPPDDLVPSDDFRAPEGVALFEAMRGGEKCYFLESPLSQEQLGEFQQKLWETYGVRSMKSASWVFYRQLNAFWKSLPEIYPSVREKHDVALADCQDWLAYPAGFALKEKFGVPLYCRMHSCEWGRSLGKPDPEGPQLSIEAAALQEADFFQSVSASELRFDLYRLLPLKEALAREKPRGGEWMALQAAKEKDYRDFLLTEPRGKAVLVGGRCAGVPNGIILDSWMEITAENVAAGRAALNALLPGKERYAFFIGRPARIKGIYELLDAFARLDARFGLVMSSSFTPQLFDEFMREIAARGLQDRVALRNGWIDEKLKKQMMCAADIIALPSLYEPFGIVTLEGLAADLACEANGLSGPAVVVGDTGGMKETVENRVNGLKVPMDADTFELKPELLAGVLSEAFNDAELKRKLSKGGAERVESPFYNWANIAETYGKLYARCVKNFRDSHAPAQG